MDKITSEDFAKRITQGIGLICDVVEDQTMSGFRFTLNDGADHIFLGTVARRGHGTFDLDAPDPPPPAFEPPPRPAANPEDLGPEEITDGAE